MANTKQNITSTFLKVKESTPGMWDDYVIGAGGSFVEYMEHFTDYNANDWTITRTNGAATLALAASSPCVGGVLLITDTNADDDAVSIQKLGHSFVPTAGSRIWFEIMFQASEATQIDLLAGLVVTDTSPLSNTDGVYFRKDDGDTAIDFETNASSVASTETAIGTFSANTYFKLGFKITGTSLVEYYINNVKQGEFTSSIPTVPLRVTFHMQDGDTGAALGALTSSIDYIRVVQEVPHWVP